MSTLNDLPPSLYHTPQTHQKVSYLKFEPCEVVLAIAGIWGYTILGCQLCC